MKDTVIIGIDPGSNGSICISWPKAPDVIECHPTPTNSEGNVCDIISETRAYCKSEKILLRVYTERVTGFIGRANKGAQMFTFGRSYEFAFGVCAALQIPLFTIEPAKWQEWLGVPKFEGTSEQKYKQRKAWIVREARQKFPECIRLIHDTADGAMITAYARTL